MAAEAKATESLLRGALTRYVPILSWIRDYDRSWLSADIIAGLTLWGLLVPEGMAYAGIAGLRPEAALYTLGEPWFRRHTQKDGPT